MMKRHNLFIVIIILPGYLLLNTTLYSCNTKVKEFKSPAGYNLNHPYVINLPPELDDISGIAYYRKDNSLFAESDQKGCLYKIFLNKPTDIRKWKFGHKRDYEDIVLHDSTFYILNNNGNIVGLRFVDDSLTTNEYIFPENGKNEFETLFYDDTTRKLVLLCKDCEADKNATVSAFNFDPQQFAYSAGFTIDVANIAAMTGPNSTKFKPSGASINPRTGELYILSSISRLLIVADRTGTIKEIYNLDPSIFNKPEGISFAPNGNLFISNEAGQRQPPTILYYQYNNTIKK